MFYLKLLLILTIFSLIYIFYTHYSMIPKIEYSPLSNQLSWIRILKDVYLSSFYYDERIMSFRFIGYSESGLHPKLYCYFNPSYYECKAKYESEKDLGKEFFFLLIPYPSVLSIPNFILINEANISLKLIQNRMKNENENNKINNVLCITKMINYKSKNYFLEYIESYIHLGINKFIIYKHNCSNDVERILDYYVNKNKIEIIEWYNKSDINHSGLIHYTYGQHWKYNDCFYRNRNIANNILFSDLDEIFWPYKYESINSLLENYDKSKSDIYYFQPELHILEYFEVFDRYIHNISDFDMYDENSEKTICLVNPKLVDKYIITNSKLIYSVFIHYPFNKSKNTKEIYIPNEVGVLRHMRRAPSAILSKCKIINESKIQKKVKEDLKRIVIPKVNLIKSLLQL